jgi:lipoprotein-anchoring transpeptidase ErfK/SrfK
VRLRPFVRVFSLAALVFVSATTLGDIPGAGAQTTPVRHGPVLRGPTQQLAALLVGHEAYSEPDTHSEPLRFVASDRPITGERTVLPVLGTAVVPHQGTWLNVMLPGRPDSQTGWIQSRKTMTATTSYSIVVDTASRALTVYQYGSPVFTAPAVVGKPSTPTPLGRFFVEEVVEMPASAVGAPIAFALSARSNVLQEFDGGPGQIALHGLENIGGVLGTAESHGCIRLSNATLTWMVTRIGPGVPVTITS